MLIRAATIGYGRDPDFEVQAPNGPLTDERIAYVMLHDCVFREAFERERIRADDKLLNAILRKGEDERCRHQKNAHSMLVPKVGPWGRL